MPYRWTSSTDNGTEVYELHLWQHQSLEPKGFVIFFALTAILVALPLLAVLGTPALWAILGFVVLALVGMWTALRRNAHDARLSEHLRLTADGVTLEHRPARGPYLHWQAAPRDIRVLRYADSGPVPHYLTLSDAGREVELGRFLTPNERYQLEHELRQKLRKFSAN